MKVGDLVRDRNDINHKIFGYGVITRMWGAANKKHKYATVQFANDVMNMYWTKLVVVNESR
tara:strand:+ start:563 stop:745 length:183 start_codon:yes stop_codon:yes gene_type:complete